jgi:putative membrane protein
MTENVTDGSPQSLSLTSRLALERTRGAYERTLMAWVRTGTSLITFGFAVYKFFQLEIAETVSKSAPLIQTSLIGPREFGLVLIAIGLLTLLLGTFEHGRDLRALHRDYPAMPRSGTRLIAILIGILGLLAFVGVVYRF